MPKAPTKKRSTVAKKETVKKEEKTKKELVKKETDSTSSDIITRANRVIKALEEELGVTVDAKMNDGIKPRKGALEITMVKDGKKHELWTAVNLGPPRALKEPDMEVIVKRAKAI